MSSFYTYILSSERNNSFYVGCTKDIEKRLERHNQGRVKSTKTGIPWKLEYSEGYKTKSEAVIREGLIKSWKSRKAIERLLALSSSG